MSRATGDIWSKLKFDLAECRTIFQMRLETKGEAIGKRRATTTASTNKAQKWIDTAPRWVDEAHGQSVRPWLMIPFVDAIDQEELADRLEAGKRLLASIELRVEARELTPELVKDWGLLNRWAGALELIYHTQPNVGRLREGAEHLDDHKRWFAHNFLRIYKRGRLDAAFDEIELFVNTALSQPEYKDWFSRFLSDTASDRWEDKRRLTNAFRKDLSVAEMRRLQATPLSNDIPNIHLNLPHP